VLAPWQGIVARTAGARQRQDAASTRERGWNT